MTEYHKIAGFDNENRVVNDEEPDPCDRNITYVLYKRRWLMMLLFIATAICNSMQLYMYTIITDVVVKFYGTSPSAATWTGTINLLVYILFAYPACYIQQKVGLQMSVLIGIVSTCLGAWIKAFSIYPDQFWLLLVGQAEVGFSSAFILPLIPKITAVWFGANEVGKASGLTIFGIMVGQGIGFVVPPLVVNSAGSHVHMHHQLKNLSVGTALITSIVLFFVVVLFENEPPTAPSPAQLKVKQKSSCTAIDTNQSLRRIFLDTNFRSFIMIYGINVGLFYTFAMVLQPIVLKNYPHAAVDAGVIGLLMVTTGAAGALLSGVILDIYNAYRKTAIVVCLAALLSILIFTFTSFVSLTMVYISIGLIGCTLVSFVVIGYEIAVEMTYPEPENISGGLIVLFPQLFGVVFIYFYTFFFYNVSEILANITASGLCAVALALMCLLPIDLKRYEAQTGVPFYSDT